MNKRRVINGFNRKINHDVKLIIHEHIRHAYLCHQKLKNYHLFMEEACDLIRELVDKQPK